MPTPLLPIDPDLEPVHTREYEVRVFRRPDGQLLARGAVRDTPAAGTYIADDTEPVVMHHMVVEMVVDLDGLVISEVTVAFETFPNPGCTAISDHYQQLVGLSIARGFTHKVRELFGGPRGCTHTTALLQAMAHCIVQAAWSASAQRARPGVDAAAADPGAGVTANLNTCHVWAEGGEHLARIRRGERRPPIPIVARLDELGLDVDSWRLPSSR